MPPTAVKPISVKAIEILPREVALENSRAAPLAPFGTEVGSLLAGTKMSPQRWNELIDDARAVTQLLEGSAALVEHAVLKVCRASQNVAKPEIEAFAKRALFLLLAEYDPNKQPFPQFVKARLPLRTIDQIREEGKDIHRQRRIETAIIRRRLRGLDAHGSSGTTRRTHFRPNRVALSLDKPLSPDSEQTLAERVTSREDVHSVVDRMDQVQNVRKLTHRLAPNLRKVFEYLHERQASQRTACQILGLSESYMSRLVQDLTGTLTKLIEDKGNKPAPRNKELRLGLPVLAREAKAFPQKDYSWADLRDFISTPADLVRLSRSAEPSLKRVWRQLSPSGTFGPELWATNQAAFEFARELFSRTFVNLDAVKLAPGVAAMVGCAANSRRGEFVHDAEIARAAVRTGLVSPFRPAGHPVSRNPGSPSRYHLESIVQEGPHCANIVSLSQELFPHFDCLTKEALPPYLRGLIVHPELASVPREAQNKITIDQVSERLLAMEAIKAEIPRGHRLPTDRLSGYFFSPSIPEEIREQNFRTWIEDNIPTLDDVQSPMLYWMSRYLGGDYNRTELMAQLVERGYRSGKVPAHHPLTIGTSVSAYFKREVVGETLARENLHEFLRYSYRTAADIEANNQLRSVLKLLGLQSVKDLRQYCETENVFRIS
ncbi:MAG: hypothetical protein J0M12_06415 [Deltaproteobacteria bacterium]|nr:hypothetical protein [Deltaproteobacteria bacterium]